MTTNVAERVIRSGAAYFALVFAAGFGLGVVRTFAIEPAVGDIAAVLIELPVILTVSWLSAGWIIGWFAVSGRLPERLSMGLVAFALLILAEFGLAVAAGGGADTILEHWRSTAGLLGLTGQVLFGAFPALRFFLQRG